MVDATEYVYDTLKTALGTTPVYPIYPPIGASFPCVSYREAENQPHTQADGSEYLTSLAYVIDIWSKSVLTNIAIRSTINSAMTAAGFARAFSSPDLFEIDTGIHHKSMRYKALCTQDGILYQ